jgi:hypothetical protein
VYCSSCGAANVETAAFCQQCGSPLSKAPSPSNRSPRLADLTLDQQAWIESHKKGKGTAVLLAILATGAANLYAGQLVTGIALLLIDVVIFVPLMFIGVGFVLHLILSIIALVIAFKGIDLSNAALYTKLPLETAPVDRGPSSNVDGGPTMIV